MSTYQAQHNRSALTDPQSGDVVSKMVGKPPRHKRKYRIVIRRDGGDVYYHENHLQGTERCAWITTWESWCKNARIEHLSSNSASAGASEAKSPDADGSPFLI